jgi:hypothetical protein
MVVNKGARAVVIGYNGHILMAVFCQVASARPMPEGFFDRMAARKQGNNGDGY